MGELLAAAGPPAAAATSMGLPGWLTLLLAVTPLLAFAGGLVGNVLTRKSDAESDRRWRREESMRMLRWAIELAVSGDPEKADMGWSVVTALVISEMLDADDQVFLDAVTREDLASTMEAVEAGTVIEVADGSTMVGDSMSGSDGEAGEGGHG